MMNSVSTVNNNRQSFGMSLTNRCAREGLKDATTTWSRDLKQVKLNDLIHSARNAAGLRTSIDYIPETGIITLDGEPAKANKYIGLNLVGRISESVKEAAQKENPSIEDRIINYSA